MDKKILLEYIYRSLQKEQVKVHEPGPVVTISREYGCPGVPLAAQLTRALCDLPHPETEFRETWKMIDKEAVHMAATELLLPPETVEKTLRTRHLGLVPGMVANFSSHYTTSDVVVKKKFAAIITSLAESGYVVILGRGGEVLTHHIKQSLHIRLLAPKQWKINRIVDINKVTAKEAEQIMEAVDRERVYLRNFLAGEEPDLTYYDVILNAQTIEVPMMVKAILSILRDKKIIH